MVSNNTQLHTGYTFW